MANVELIYEKTCPNIEPARVQLAEAFRLTGLTPEWTEWDVDDPAAPARVRAFGSPTILVDGHDVAGASADEAASCCRIYTLDGKAKGVPPLDLIVAALAG